MSSRTLTPDVIGLDQFNDDPLSALKQAENGAIAVFHNNRPAFYALTPQRLAALLALEAAQQQPVPQADITLDDSLFSDAPLPTGPVPLGKFAMYSGWAPDADFLRQAALWGIILATPVAAEELAAFTSYWQAEGKVFHHIQWQQKLARHLQISRQANGNTARRDISQISRPDESIPDGFRG
ncbi:primosomal protein DnaT [Mangrovibacter phragmitis]|uniref:primosomal protein DnaT n=1 Tax=Mangrovibacter phragmitis TaxID=1691903 RepID=UPI0035116E25